jgi:uncharacterized protein (AIM24 family)
VEIEIDPSESVRAEAGVMMYMAQDIKMQASTGGGLSGILGGDKNF